MGAVERSVFPTRRGAAGRTAAGRAPVVVPQIYSDLRRQILTARMVPGAALSEVRLAEHYGVSRTPVREAFKKLAEDGFLDVIPQVGSFVARIDLRAVRDNHFVRETLECRIVGMAAQRIDADGRARLAANIATQSAAVRADDQAAFFEADEAMHALLADIAGHASAWQVIHAAKSQLDRVRYLSLADPKRSRRRLREHRTIADLVRAGDGAGASEAMREHIASVFDAVRNIAGANAHYFIGLNS